MRSSAESSSRPRLRGAQCASLWTAATVLVCHMIAGDGLRTWPKGAARQQRRHPRPPPPPTPPTGLFFSQGFSDEMVLARAPHAAVIYGGGADGSAGVAECEAVVLTWGMAPPARPSSVSAEVDIDAGTWRAVLPPQSAGSGIAVTVRCVGSAPGRNNSTVASRAGRTLQNASFGDIIFCAGAAPCSPLAALAPA